MRQVLYAKYNKLRDPRFQIRTRICQDSETWERYVEKEAVREEGRPHIEAFPRHCRAINRCFLNVEALKPQVENGVMRYPYLDGEDYDALLFGRLRGEKDILPAVREAMELIFAVRPEGLVPFTVTEDFCRVFGGDAGRRAMELLKNPQSYTASNIDMIFENVMVSDGKYYCLDYEWVMDFPVPVLYIQYRNLYYFYRKFGRWLTEVISRREFLLAFGITRELAELFRQMEQSFQEYVHGKNRCYAYPLRYEKKITPWAELERQKEQLEHETAELRHAVELKENHIQNLNVMIRDRDALLQKYAPFKKAAKMLGGKVIYKGLKKGCQGLSAAGNRIFPPETGRRRFLHGCRNAAVHPGRAGSLWLSVKKGNPFGGDPELDELYYELGPLNFPVWENPQVSVIIPVYNQLSYTYRCLASILAHTGDVTYEVIVADDVSADGTRFLPAYCKGITVVRNETNLGFLKNCNHAAQKARGRYLFFLNNDTQVRPGWLSSLVRLIESDPSIGMVGSKLVYPDGRLQEAGGIFWREGNGWNYGKFDDPDKPEYNYVKDVDYISGAAIMLSRALWDQIGGFDERFAPAYCEDADLAFAVRKAGYRVVYQPQSVVVHYEGISNGTDTGSGVKAYQLVNMEKLREKWADEFAKQEVHGEHPNPFAARERLCGRKVILVIDHYVPTFDKDAGSKSTFQYIQLFLKKGFVVKFIGDNYGHEEPYTSVFEQMGIEVLYGQWYEDHIFSWIEENRNYIQFAYINRPHIAVKYVDFIKQKTDIKIMYYGHDLHFLREMREFEVTGDPAHKKESEYMKKQELALIRKVDMSYYPSYVERDVLRQIDSSLRVKAVCLNMFETFKEDIDYDFTRRRGLIFVGGFAHHPNKDAVLWFAEEIYPLIRKELDVPFYVVGSKVPDEVKALDGRDGIEVKGFVSDEELERLYASCQAVVVPLRYGAGVKGKVIEALYNGLPVITTSIGAEGIEGAEQVMAVADQPEAFARRTVAFCRDPELSAQTGRKAVDYVKAVFSMDAVWNIIKDDFS